MGRKGKGGGGGGTTMGVPFGAGNLNTGAGYGSGGGYGQGVGGIGASKLTATGLVPGTPAYMTPEQVVGKPLDRRTDTFALGTTLWEVTAARRLFKGETDYTLVWSR